MNCLRRKEVVKLNCGTRQTIWNGEILCLQIENGEQGFHLDCGYDPGKRFDYLETCYDDDPECHLGHGYDYGYGWDSC